MSRKLMLSEERLFDTRSLFSRSACEVSNSPILIPGVPSYGLVKGRNKSYAFSTRDILRDEIITEHPVQIIPRHEVSALQVAGMEDLCYSWEDKQGTLAFALGSAAFVDHADNANCWWRPDYARGTICIRPRRPILAGEPLTVNRRRPNQRSRAKLVPRNVYRLPENSIPKPEAPKAVVILDPEFGRTLVAVRDIRAGDIISEAPVRIVRLKQMHAFSKVSVLTDLSHGWGVRLSAVVLGMPALVNHSGSANAFYEENCDRQAIALVAYKPIKAGHEIHMNYLGHPDDDGEMDWQPKERETPLIVPLVNAAA